MAENKKKENTFKPKPVPQVTEELEVVEQVKASAPKKGEEKKTAEKKEKRIEAPKEAAKKDTPKKKEPKEKKERQPRTLDPRYKYVAGFLILCVALFLALSIISYFVSYFNGTYCETSATLFGKAIQFDVITGKFGSFLSQVLIKESFGLGSVFFVYLLTLLGLNLTIGAKINGWKVWKNAIMLLFWIPLLFGFIHFVAPNKACEIFGGAVGQYLNNGIYDFMGKSGVILTLVFVFLLYLLFEFNLNIDALRQWKERLAERRALRQKPVVANHDPESPEDPETNPENDNNPQGNHFKTGHEHDLDPDDDFDDEEDDGEELPPITVIHRPKDNSLKPEDSANSATHEGFNPAGINTAGQNIELNPTNTGITPSENTLKDTPGKDMPLEVTNPDATNTLNPTVETVKDPIAGPTSNPAAGSPSKPTAGNNEKLELEIEATPEEVTLEESKEHHTIDTPYDPHYELSDYRFPPLDLLRDLGSSRAEVSNEELEANKNKIVETLANYGIQIDKIKATIGPTVTLYEIVPAAGVRISKIKNLEDDIALSLAALGIRIIAPIPGKGTIGIEVPNKKPETVSMKSVLASEKFQNNKFALPCAIGKTISNETYVFDLAKMPHILMAGATGQGKSVGLNAIVASLLYSKHPSDLKFVMVDPKKVELTLYNRIERHYLAKLPDSEDAIITDVKQVVRTLNSLCIEMDQRYDLLKAAQCRNIIEYNEKFKSRKLLPTEGHRYLPYIVLVVDEFADLIMTAGREVESPIARLAQLARAIGIHLIIATQRPSVNIITGSIKANFPARIAFRVISAVDSKTILDQSGANQLIGRGDMLLSTGNDMVRLQCAFIDTPEVEEITSFIGAQRGFSEPFHLPEVPDEDGGDSGSDYEEGDERDPLFEEAARVVVQTQQGSTSMIQRKLKLGYNRAGRIIDQLEAAGIVGAFSGSKSREVKVANEFALEQILKDLELKDQGI